MFNKLQLAENFAEEISLPEDVLRNTLVLHINHCMENSFAFSRVLGKLFHKVVFVGVPYNNKMVPWDPAFTGYCATEQSECLYTFYRDGEKTGTCRGVFLDCVRELIRKAVLNDILPLLSEEKRVLIIEDGGYHYEVIRELAEEYPFFEERIMGVVEQTTSGTVRGGQIGKERTIHYPRLSVARSDVKMNIESIYIAQRVIEELSLYLYSINTFLDFHRVLLIGYGVVGRRIAESLRHRYVDLLVYDTKMEIRDVARRDGCAVCEEVTSEMFPADTIIIGNTGRQSLTEEILLAFFKGEAKRLYLASSSSQEEEFFTFLCMARGERPFPDGVVPRGHQSFDGVDDYSFGYTGTDGLERKKEIILITKGRPVNFFRQDVISLTDCVIDLVFSEMLYLALWLCTNPGMEKKLFLLGDSETPFDEGKEEELFRKWLSFYQLSEETGMRAFYDAHPAAHLLRGVGTHS